MPGDACQKERGVTGTRNKEVTENRNGGGNSNVSKGRDRGVKMTAGFKTQAEKIWTRTPCWFMGSEK